MSRPNILVILSSQAVLPATGNPTGWYLPEFAHPYSKLANHVDMTVASPKGGRAPVDPYSIESTKDDPVSQEFLNTKSHLFEETLPLSKLLGRAAEFDALFYVGGHGPMFDLAENQDSQALVREFYENGKIVSAVCHGPAALASVKLSDGSYLVKDQEVTGLSNEEEDILQFTQVMPFLLESRLSENGGIYKKAIGPFQGNVLVSGDGGRLITGQNPPSAGLIGEVLLKALQK